MKTLSIAQAAYCAAMIDGEGNISVQRSLSKNKQRWEYTMSIDVVNTDSRVLYWLKQVTGIGIVSPKSDSGKPSHHKKAFEWRLRSYEMKNFILQIQPYLILKAEQAELMLEFLDSCKSRGYRISEEADLLRRIIWSEMSDLNKRGA